MGNNTESQGNEEIEEYVKKKNKTLEKDLNEMVILIYLINGWLYGHKDISQGQENNA